VAAEATSLSEFVALCDRFAGMSVGRRDGVGDGGARGGRRAEGVAARAAAAAVFLVVVPVASLGILLGPFLLVVVADFPVTPAVDLSTRVGRCSEAVALGPVERTGAFALGLEITPSAGNTSAPSSSSSESTATLFWTGVFLGWPGGAMAFAFAWAAAICLLGVTGGTVTPTATTLVGVVWMVSSISSPASAGGVAGVVVASAVAACTFRISSTAAHFDHSSCLRYIYCC
jgi:hypothetical protein